MKIYKKSYKSVLMGLILIFQTSIALATLSKAKSLPLELKGKTQCTWYWVNDVKVDMQNLLQEVSKELIIYDFAIRPVLLGDALTINGESAKINGFIDFSTNNQRYIPKAINKGLAEIITYDQQDCLWIKDSFITEYQDQVKSLKPFSRELLQVDAFLEELIKLIDKKDISLLNEPIIWLGKEEKALEVQYTKSMIKELIDMGDISIRSPSIFDFQFISINNDAKRLTAEVDIVTTKDMAVIDRFVITYVNDSWRIALPSL